MEGEGADVSLFVLLLLVEAFLKLSSLLFESPFLGHLFLLFVGLHYSAFASEVFQFAVEDLVFPQFTLQRTVIKRNLDRRFESYLVETLLAVAQHPCLIVEEMMFQSFTYGAIGA